LSAEASLPKILLVGGAPKSGKSTFARELAARLRYDTVSGDDLASAARAVTTRQSHPELHPMAGLDYREYYIGRPLDALWDDAMRLHRAVWKLIVNVANERASWGRPAVVEGWSILPELVVSSDLVDARGLWLLVEEDVFERRVRDVAVFYEGASDEDLLIRGFAERSRMHNRFLGAEAAKHGVPTLLAGPDDTVAGLCDRALELLQV
jgi:2-phosphoglycerate kinase